MPDVIAQLEARIGYTFKDRSLIERAMTHASFGDGKADVRSYERLEFLGDRVLGLMTAEALFRVYDKAKEGGLAPRLNTLVCKETCAEVAEEVKLGEALRMGKSEDKGGGRRKKSILGDACEALIAALYLDGGRDAAQGFYDTYWEKRITALDAKPSDAKSALQEWAAKAGHASPRYTMRERSGPDHRPIFTVEVSVAPLDPAVGEGGSKQAAERAAATALLQREGHDV
ncbi:ribonuclease III [Maricaulis sp. CAU 1757]